MNMNTDNRPCSSNGDGAPDVIFLGLFIIRSRMRNIIIARSSDIQEVGMTITTCNEGQEQYNIRIRNLLSVGIMDNITLEV